MLRRLPALLSCCMQWLCPVEWCLIVQKQKPRTSRCGVLEFEAVFCLRTDSSRSCGQGKKHEDEERCCRAVERSPGSIAGRVASRLGSQGNLAESAWQACADSCSCYASELTARVVTLDGPNTAMLTLAAIVGFHGRPGITVRQEALANCRRSTRQTPAYIRAAI